MTCVGNITDNDRSFDCFLPLYNDGTSDNDRYYGTRFNVNFNTKVETRFMDVDRLQSDLEKTLGIMDTQIDNFKRYMKSVHEKFYKNFNVNAATNSQISRISKAVNITNQTFSALDLWMSTFSDYITELYDEIEKYQNSKTKIIVIMNKIKQQDVSSRTDAVVKFKRDEAFKQSLNSERNRLINVENSIRSKLYSLNNYYAKFERGLIPADRKSNKVINLKSILKVADLVYGTSTKLTDLQLDIIRNINNKPTSIIYHNQRMPNVLERVSKPLNYVKPVNDDGQPENYEMIDLSTNDTTADRNVVENQRQMFKDTTPINSNGGTIDDLLFETNDEFVRNDVTEKQKVVDKDVTLRQKSLNMWINQVQDAEMLLTDETTTAISDTDTNESQIRSEIDRGIEQIRTLEKELRPVILENVRIRMDKQANLNDIDEKMRENMISAELDRQLRVRAAEMRDRENEMRNEYERKITELNENLASSTRTIESLKRENQEAMEKLKRQLDESDKRMNDIQTRFDERTKQYEELRVKLSKLRSDLQSTQNEREQTNQLTDTELTEKNRIIRELEEQQKVTNTALETCMVELEQLHGIAEREKTKNDNLLKNLKERQNEKTKLEQRFADEIEAFRERERTLKTQLNDNKNRIDLLTRESQAALSKIPQYEQTITELTKKYQDLQKKYENTELTHKRELDEKIQQLNEEMLKNTDLLTHTMQKKINDLTEIKNNLEMEYQANLEKLKTSMDNQDRQENERLRTELYDRDRRIDELSRALDDVQQRARIVQSVNVDIDKTIDTAIVGETRETPRSGKVKIKKNRNLLPYQKNRTNRDRRIDDDVVASVVNDVPVLNVANVAEHESANTIANVVTDKLVRAIDGVTRSSQQTDPSDSRLYTIVEPLSVDTLQLFIDKIWLYIGTLSRDEYNVQRLHVINGIKFEDIKTIQPSSTDFDTYGPSKLFDYMAKGVYAANNAILILSKYWLYYERTAQFIHACLERACWTLLTIVELKELVSKIVLNTPDRVYAEYMENKKNPDRYQLIELQNIFYNVPADDTYNVERFKILYKEYDKSIDENVARKVARKL